MGFDNVNVNASGPIQPTSTYKTKVLKGNHSFASQVTEPNMKYVIKHDFVLDGNVTIPANCVLEFDGGSISAGSGENKDTITGQNTFVKAPQIKIFNNIKFDGSFSNLELYIDWFCVSGEDISSVLTNLINYVSESVIPSKILFSGKTYYADNYIDFTCTGNTPIELQGIYRTTKIVARTVGTYLLFRGANEDHSFKIKDIIFDGNNNVLHTAWLPMTSLSDFTNVWFIGGIKRCYTTFNTYISSYTNCRFVGIFTKTEAAAFFGTGACNAITITGCSFESCYIGIAVNGGWGVNIISCVIEGNLACGIYSAANKGLNIDSCYFENNGDNLKKRLEFKNKTGALISKVKINNTEYNINPFKIHSDIILDGATISDLTISESGILEYVPTAIIDLKSSANNYKTGITIRGCNSQRRAIANYTDGTTETFVNSCLCFSPYAYHLNIEGNVMAWNVEDISDSKDINTLIVPVIKRAMCVQGIHLVSNSLPFSLDGDKVRFLNVTGENTVNGDVSANYFAYAVSKHPIFKSHNSIDVYNLKNKVEGTMKCHGITCKSSEIAAGARWVVYNANTKLDNIAYKGKKDLGILETEIVIRLTEDNTLLFGEQGDLYRFNCDVAANEICIFYIYMIPLGEIDLPYNVPEINRASTNNAASVTFGFLPKKYFHLNNKEVTLLSEISRSDYACIPTDLQHYVGNYVGQQLFDEVNKKPLWWNGTNWVDATGNNPDVTPEVTEDSNE